MNQEIAKVRKIYVDSNAIIYFIEGKADMPHLTCQTKGDMLRL